MYWVHQKFHLGFSVTSYRKTQMNFLANTILLHLFFKKLAIYSRVGSAQPYHIFKLLLKQIKLKSVVNWSGNFWNPIIFYFWGFDFTHPLMVEYLI